MYPCFKDFCKAFTVLKNKYDTDALYVFCYGPAGEKKFGIEGGCRNTQDFEAMFEEVTENAPDEVISVEQLFFENGEPYIRILKEDREYCVTPGYECARCSTVFLPTGIENTNVKSFLCTNCGCHCSYCGEWTDPKNVDYKGICSVCNEQWPHY